MPINTNLTANTKKFQFAYDSTKQKYGYTIDGTFYPFSSGAVKVGTYSADTTIDVSAFSPTDAKQFLLVPNNSANANYSFNSAGAWRTGYFGYTNYSLSLNGNNLAITLPYSSVTHLHGTDTVRIPCDLYFVGDVESAS